MGYFSNGTEGLGYQETYCVRCIHDRDQSCPVWLAHLIYNYDECDNEGSILHMLIPRQENGVGNKQCLMFIEDHNADTAAPALAPKCTCGAEADAWTPDFGDVCAKCASDIMMFGSPQLPREPEREGEKP